MPANLTRAARLSSQAQRTAKLLLPALLALSEVEGSNVKGSRVAGPPLLYLLMSLLLYFSPAEGTFTPSALPCSYCRLFPSLLSLTPSLSLLSATDQSPANLVFSTRYRHFPSSIGVGGAHHLYLFKFYLSSKMKQQLPSVFGGRRFSSDIQSAGADEYLCPPHLRFSHPGRHRGELRCSQLACGDAFSDPRNTSHATRNMAHRTRCPRPHPLPLFRKDVILKNLSGRVCKSCDSKGLTEEPRQSRRRLRITARPAE